jgi:hypothetical protein
MGDRISWKNRLDNLQFFTTQSDYRYRKPGERCGTPLPLPTEDLLTLNASGCFDDAVNEQAGKRAPEGRPLQLLWWKTRTWVPLYVSRLRQEVLLHSHDEAQPEPSNARWKTIACNTGEIIAAGTP